MKSVEFQLEGDHIALCDLLKVAGVTGSGGAGKLLVANGEVKVDGQPESRKTAKIRAGQTVQCMGINILITHISVATPNPGNPE